MRAPCCEVLLRDMCVGRSGVAPRPRPRSSRRRKQFVNGVHDLASEARRLRRRVRGTSLAVKPTRPPRRLGGSVVQIASQPAQSDPSSRYRRRVNALISNQLCKPLRRWRQPVRRKKPSARAEARSLERLNGLFTQIGNKSKCHLEHPSATSNGEDQSTSGARRCDHTERILAVLACGAHGESSKYKSVGRT